VPPATSAKADDLLGLSFDIGGTSAATSSSNASLLTESLFSNSAAQQQNFPVTNSTGFPNLGSSAVTSPLQSPTGHFTAAFPPIGSGGFSPASTPSLASQPQSLPLSQAFSSSSGSFGGDLLTPVLEPAKPSANGSISNHPTSNNNNNNSAKPSLQVILFFVRFNSYNFVNLVTMYVCAAGYNLVGFKYQH